MASENRPENQVQEETYQVETTADAGQMNFRKELATLFRESPLNETDLLFNLGLYTRSSLLVKYIVMSKLYERVKHLPGVFMEFGVWYGQNMVLLENLRAIYEPFNKQRKIVGFDTFEGYAGASGVDKNSHVWTQDSYATGDYQPQLEKLLEVHEGNNVLGHIRGRHELVKGDVTQTVPAYFEKHPETLVAFAYFDLGLYKPTRVALEHVAKHSVPGTVILLDELTWGEAPGEAIAFKEVFANRKYEIERMDLYPSKSIVTLKNG